MTVFIFFMVLSSVVNYGLCETTEAAVQNDTNAQIHVYGSEVSSSRNLTREDRTVIKSWTDEFLIKRVDVSLKYRMEMIRHEEYNFKVNGNVEWISCLQLNKEIITEARRFYRASESDCLRRASNLDMDKKRDVEQIEKQMTQWRRGYRYLVNLCKKENPENDESSDTCLIKYMQQDNCDDVIQRLKFLKLKAMSDLHAYYSSSVFDLDECLRAHLSEYLEKIRTIRNILQICYQKATHISN